MKVRSVKMNWCCIVLCFATYGATVRGAALAGADLDQQGLYSKSDNVEILTNLNFDRKVYHQPHATIVQFYNSYCGHCRIFSPKYKSLATELVPWRDILRFAVVDCSVEENNEYCRDFEVMAYPTMRYMHENYVKANGNLGDDLRQVGKDDQLKALIINKLMSEQKMGRANQAPSFNISSYTSYRNALSDIPIQVLYTFLVFENENSTVGSELALNLHNYQNIKVKRVLDNSELAAVAHLENFPGIVAVSSSLDATQLTPKTPTAPKFTLAANNFLKSNNYKFPEMEPGLPEIMDIVNPNIPELPNVDAVYYSDLENTLKISLRTEITRHPTLTGEPLQALLDYLDVLITSFPFRGNLKAFITGLRATILTKNSWTGSELYNLVKQLEESYSPVFLTTTNDFIACKGSATKYRGYSCGLWSLFHTLTVNAARKSGLEGPKVLKAMHGYIKHFFGCTECSEHFQAMAARNRLFDVKENDKAVLWLWISHNEVNLRLAGDVTEDPQFPKIQFPSVSRCPACRLSRGAWNLPAVYEYLQSVYGAESLRDVRRARAAANALAPSPFSDLDIGMLSLLYLSSFIILILVIKYFLTRGFYRKRHYKHGLGKV